MLIKRAARFTSGDVTDPTLYISRRELMTGAAAWTLWPVEGGAAGPAAGRTDTPRPSAFSASATALPNATGVRSNTHIAPTVCP